MHLILTDEQKMLWKTGEKITCIYKVTNLDNGLIYIGQTLNLHKRFSDYNSPTKYLDERYRKLRPIYRALYEYGQDKFSMEIVELCDINILGEREKFYIEKYHSNDPNRGYNKLNGSEFNKKKMSEILSKAHTGLKESNATKRKKSNLIIAIELGENNDPVKVILCDSGKLFGDFMHTTKDVVKNCLRRPCKLKNYYLIYDDIVKRHEQFDKMLGKRSIRNKDFMELIMFLIRIEMDSVENIYVRIEEEIAPIYYLAYENRNDDGTLYLKKFTLPAIEEDKSEF